MPSQPIPIPQVRDATDEELREMRHALGNRVNVYFLRADLDGPDPDRDRTCASYVALLAMVDAERLRRSKITDLDRLSGRDRPFGHIVVTAVPESDEWEAEIFEHPAHDESDPLDLAHEAPRVGRGG